MTLTARLFAAVVWAGLIFFASSLPASATGPGTPLWTLFLKSLHFTNFGILALLLLALLSGTSGPARTTALWYLVSLLLTILFAITDEYHQKFSSGRHPSAKDVVIDSLGALVFLIGWYAMLNVPKRIQRESEKKP